jgi:hypothetical protein
MASRPSVLRGEGSGQAMRYCPLIKASFPCSEAAPLCDRCPKPVPTKCPAVKPVAAGPSVRTCIGCGGEYVASGKHQVRCPSCGEKHAQVKNAKYQAEHRKRVKGKP